MSGKKRADVFPVESLERMMSSDEVATIIGTTRITAERKMRSQMIKSWKHGNRRVTYARYVKAYQDALEKSAS